MFLNTLMCVWFQYITVSLLSFSFFVFFTESRLGHVLVTGFLVSLWVFLSHQHPSESSLHSDSRQTSSSWMAQPTPTIRPWRSTRTERKFAQTAMAANREHQVRHMTGFPRAMYPFTFNSMRSHSPFDLLASSHLFGRYGADLPKEMAALCEYCLTWHVKIFFLFSGSRVNWVHCFFVFFAIYLNDLRLNGLTKDQWRFSQRARNPNPTSTAHDKMCPSVSNACPLTSLLDFPWFWKCLWGQFEVIIRL